VQGISVGSTQMFQAMNRAIEANGIKPVIDKVFGFDEVQGNHSLKTAGMTDYVCTRRAAPADIPSRRA
jgi:NADPH:quinone reductase-like Zn-dependent oxidoreductase